jgi:hypothetical protein
VRPTTLIPLGIVVVAGVALAGRSGPWISASEPSAATVARLESTPTTTHYRTLPGIAVPVLEVRRAAALGGDLFEAPRGRAAPAALEILDGHGNLIWYHRVPAGLVATDFRAQTYKGRKVLTWWQGAGVKSAFVIMDSRYRIIRTVKPAHGYSANEHEFLLTNNGADAWVIGSHLVSADMSRRGGSHHAPVIEEVAQEIDLATGKVLFEWHSSAHVAPAASYAPYAPGHAYDYFHMNSIDPQRNGIVVISARNTHAVYGVAMRTGRIVWQLGGKRSSFRMGPGASFALQHDARMHGPTTMSLFDNQDAPPNYAPARAITLHLDFAHRTATLSRALTHGGLKVPWQGNIQVLARGATVVGWGSGGVTSVFARSGRLIFDGSYSGGINSYRAYVMPWAGVPTTSPSVALQPAGHGVDVLASWNGSTATQRWVVLAGPTASNLHRVATAGRRGFQTAIRLSARPRYVQVLAQTRNGAVLGRSAIIGP